MEYYFEKGEIHSSKILNELDKFTIDFIDVLEKYSDYVIVSGYVSILLGRSRASEDIDLLIPKMEFHKFKNLFEELLNKGYECVNTSNVKEAYNMLSEHAIRFFEKGSPIPNIEFKIIKTELEEYAFNNKIKVVFGADLLFISPIELQIAFKLFLAAEGTDKELQSDKDIEDARHLYKQFKEKINKVEFLYFIDKLNVGKKLKWLE